MGNVGQWERNRGHFRPPVVGLSHELIGHGFDLNQGTFDGLCNTSGVANCEISAVNAENLLRDFTGADLRKDYSGINIPDESLINPNLYSPNKIELLLTSQLDIRINLPTPSLNVIPKIKSVISKGKSYGNRSRFGKFIYRIRLRFRTPKF